MQVLSAHDENDLCNDSDGNKYIPKHVQTNGA